MSEVVEYWKQKMGPIAMQASQKSGVPYKFIMAQTANETSWGKSPLFTKYFNVGGIKAVDGHEFVEELTPEDVEHPEKYPQREVARDMKIPGTNLTRIYLKLKFAKFPDLQTGIDYYLQHVLMNEYFRPYIEQAKGDPNLYVELLQSGGPDGKHPKYGTGANYVKLTKQLISYF